MFSLSRVVLTKMSLSKTGIFQMLSSNYSQLVKKNVFYFASTYQIMLSKNYKPPFLS